MKVLSRWYDIEIEVKKEIEPRNNFNYVETLNKVVKVSYLGRIKWHGISEILRF